MKKKHIEVRRNGVTSLYWPLAYIDEQIKRWSAATSLDKVHDLFLDGIDRVLASGHLWEWNVIPYRAFLDDDDEFYADLARHSLLGLTFRAYVHDNDGTRATVPVSLAFTFGFRLTRSMRRGGKTEIDYCREFCERWSIKTLLRWEKKDPEFVRIVDSDLFPQESILAKHRGFHRYVESLLGRPCQFYFVPPKSPYSCGPIEWYGYEAIPGIRPRCRGRNN